MQRTDHRSGFVVLLGRPSSGKSTLVNAVCGQHVSIVSSIPQTTRNVIRGIYSEERGQIVFLDTPGIHRSDKQINQRLRHVALENVPDAELVVYLLDSTRAPGDEERDLAKIVAEHDLPVIVAITKCDERESAVEPARAFLQEVGLSHLQSVELAGLPPELASKRRGVDRLLDLVFSHLPEGPPWYPAEFYTDQDPRFRIAEIVREEAIKRTREEVPHAIFVDVADVEQRGKTLWARAFILVERDSQQGIVVGKRGATITAIRTSAERALSEIFPSPVRLSLQVKVHPRWRRDKTLLDKLIQ